MWVVAPGFAQEGQVGTEVSNYAFGLKAGETLTEQYEYTVVDSNGNFDTALITINIVGQQDAIVGLASPRQDAYLTEDMTLTFDDVFVTSNYFDRDAGFNSWGEGLSIQSFDTSSLQGTLSDNGDGSYTYDPTVAFDSLEGTQGATDTLSMVLASNDGSQLTAYIDFEIYGIDDPIV